jgi:hypothetical protein
MAANLSRTTQSTTQNTSTMQLGPTASIVDTLSKNLSTLCDCNLKAAQDGLDRTATATAKLFGAKTPVDLFLVTDAHAQPNCEARPY